jgi:hypothetical protein
MAEKNSRGRERERERERRSDVCWVQIFFADTVVGPSNLRELLPSFIFPRGALLVFNGQLKCWTDEIGRRGGWRREIIRNEV